MVVDIVVDTVPFRRWRRRGLTRGEAHVFRSAPMDPKVSEVADASHGTMAAEFPKSIFPRE